ncbi:MAG: mRNA surveillance protein pelota [Candidatus Aramenus sp.]|nr:mRNA surveillance protein pelota [Candidatus Aramenus sp.]
MKVLEFDEKKGSLKLHIEDEDDLWLLHLILHKGDVIIARTTRDVSLGNEGRRIPMVIALRVEHTEFQPFTSRLRIHGIIEDAPERFGIKGAHHTVNLDIGDDIVIVKEQWPKHELEKIYAQAEKRSKVLIALVDFDEYLIAIPMAQGIRVLAERSLQTPNKEDEGIIEENAEEVAKEVEEYARQFSPDAVVLAGPGPFKEIVRAKLKFKNVYVDSVSSATRAGLSEILRRDIIDKVMRDYEISQSIREMDRVMELLSKNTGLVAYGLEEVKRATQYRAVETLLVTSDLVSAYDEEEKKEIEEVMEEVGKKGGKVMIVPEDSPVYFQVKNLTGLVAVLRFRIE